MSPSITKVALASPSGNLGPSILAELVSAGCFQITALVRRQPSSPFPEGVKAVVVDYSSPSSLEASLHENGIEAVISTLPPDPADTQLALLRASVNAGTVRRFIPSEFGSNTSNPKARELPVYGGKLALQEEMIKAAKDSESWSYTIVQNGPFMDWKPWLGGFVTSGKDKKFTRVEGGEVKFSTTTLRGVGKAVVGALKMEKETKNRVVRVHQRVLTLNELWGFAKRVLGDEGWEIENMEDVEEVVRLGREELKKGVIMPAMLKFLTASCFSEGYGQWFEENDNELLGLEQLSDDEVLEVVKKLVA